MRIFGFYSLLLVLFLVSCEYDQSKDTDKKDRAEPKSTTLQNSIIDTILHRKKLVAATDYGSVNYLIYRGEPIGFQYEILKDLTDHLGVELDLIIQSDIPDGIQMLNNEQIDILAMGLTVTNNRVKEMAFTVPLFTTRQVLVQRKPDGYLNMETADEIESHLIRSPLDLAKKDIYVQRGTIFEKRLHHLSNEIADTIYVIADSRDVEDLILAVSLGEIDYTIADEHIANVNSRYYHNIDVQMPVSFPQKISWAVKKDQKALLDTIDSWLAKFKKTLRYRLLYNKYFKNIRSGKIVKSQYNSYTGGSLSPYDDEIKKAAKKLDWDWRLLGSMIYQESQFKPNVESWVGAYGLMQLMPHVMEEYGIDKSASPALQINVGVLHLKSIDRQIPDVITDSTERVKFLLASYNCGLGHVLDARRLAEKYGKDPNVWTNSVDSCILNLSEKEYYHDPVVYNGYVRGSETFSFVQEIIERFNIYKELIKE